MKLAHSSVIVVAFAATAAHAQLNLLGVIQSAQSAIAQGTSSGKPDIPSGTALLQQAKGLAAQQVWAQKSSEAQQENAQDMATRQAQQNAFMQQQQAKDDAGQAAGDKRVRDAEEYHEKAQQESAQRAAQAATQARAACPELANKKLGLGAAMVTCKNKGMSEQQMMATFGDAPIAAQAYASAVVQDIYEDNVTSPRRGNDVSDYYDKCYRRGTPCPRPQW
ncbi:hypothetical protein DR64_104 [Paraburkholderia xenovorans LB400]|uniref:Lipoprotein n=1 Tax=Paraburkholderia xenovorans (strain LB400) TaxID=266265 RepID=Q13ZC1_PARXL|nr:hypothetical protein [Paraburkholderia xenovorans]ABE30568.1 hypothetical protein Bxe_A2401 [Paraburkholderia xenovorans LB400]AIP33803.1 hypothetical protein DR64_104 [Paraburkholderia xenovorans LB400]